MSKATPKLPLEDLLAKIEPTKAAVCRQILNNYQDVIYDLPGSMTKHQAWPGGYIAHIEEVMNLAIVLHEALDKQRRLPFSLSDALFVLFLHDFDKLLRYKRKNGKFVAVKSHDNDYADQVKKLLKRDYNYTLSADEHNALKYAHGEGADYHPTKRIMRPLATLVHCCDVISARIWHDYGRDSHNW